MKRKLVEKYFAVSLVLFLTFGVYRLFGMNNYVNRSLEINEPALPFFVTIYYHIEPNYQLFESVEPGYFETVSSCLRQMSTDLAAIDVHATFCFSWLYNDIVHHRNRDPNKGVIINQNKDTGIETFERLVSDNHEIAYHTHPPIAVIKEGKIYYARPNPACTYFDTLNIHRWSGAGADKEMKFEPGVFHFDDSTDVWYGQFIWERTAESLFRIAKYLGINVRHANGGQKPLLDVTNSYGYGINHPHCLQQTRSLMGLGLDLIAPECMPFFNMDYSSSGELWSDTSTWYVSYLDSEANCQIYYPDINNDHLEQESKVSQGLTFMPVQKKPQVNWEGSGVKDSDYYNAEREGSYGGGGVRWTHDTFYARYGGNGHNPWQPVNHVVDMPSLADQFNSAVEFHAMRTPNKVNAWGLNHHVVNVMWANLSGLSDNWDKEIDFLRDIADGVADGEIKSPRPDLVRFVTMQELSSIYDDVATQVYMHKSTDISQQPFLFQNHPNPFNSQTIITFKLNKDCKVSLKVCNVYGHEVAKLLEGSYMAGQYDIQFNGSSLPSGTYMYKIEVDNLMLVKKLLIIK